MQCDSGLNYGSVACPSREQVVGSSACRVTPRSRYFRTIDRAFREGRKKIGDVFGGVVAPSRGRDMCLVQDL